MTGSEVMDIAQEAMWVLLKVCAPILLTALVVGLIIALFQALTQIQEMTLTFVPKIIAIFVAMVIFLPFMGQTLSALMIALTDRIAQF
jgi:flagellar biosynthetic protein FliQ